MSGWLEVSWDLDYSDKPRCGAKPLDVPELTCLMPKDEAVHIMFGGHVGRSPVDGKMCSWRDGGDPKGVSVEERRAE